MQECRALFQASFKVPPYFQRPRGFLEGAYEVGLYEMQCDIYAILRHEDSAFDPLARGFLAEFVDLEVCGRGLDTLDGGYPNNACSFSLSPWNASMKDSPHRLSALSLPLWRSCTSWDYG